MTEGLSRTSVPRACETRASNNPTGDRGDVALGGVGCRTRASGTVNSNATKYPTRILRASMVDGSPVGVVECFGEARCSQLLQYRFAERLLLESSAQVA